MPEALATLESDSVPPRERIRRRPGQRGKDLTGYEVADILRLHAQGLSQNEIAAKFDPPKAQSTICEALARFGSDRTAEAKAILASAAPEMALNIVRRGKPKDQVVALKGLSVLDDADGGRGLTVVVGGNAHVQINTFAPAVREAERKPVECLVIQAGSDK